jgi:hypothetical protein
VAACRHCNAHRHRRDRAPEPTTYRQFVQRRIASGRWFGSWVEKLRPGSERSGLNS